MRQRIPAPAAWFLFFAWFGVLFWLSEQSLAKMPGPEIPHMDKVYHAGFFFVGGIFLTIALAGSFPFSRQAIIVSGIAVLGTIGIFDEWHQTFNVHRSGGDVSDWLADLAGGTIAVLLVAIPRYGRFVGLTERKTSS